ncbi:unnamed protein product [Blepharisma stoltei]|uniref:Exophilin 5 n=1 Tax=Blepharisma stoltei TaxID=1481888 RepID=A0AAU9KAQ4_9CILI|nr:unnamed protein product [Blepharisma stoltei]
MDVSTVLKPRRTKTNILTGNNLAKVFSLDEENHQLNPQKIVKNDDKSHFLKRINKDSDLNSSSSETNITKKINPVDEKLHKIPRVKAEICGYTNTLPAQPQKIEAKHKEKQINNFTFEADSRLISAPHKNHNEAKMPRSMTPDQPNRKSHKIAIPHVPLIIHNCFGDTINKEKISPHTGILSFLDDIQNLGLDEVPIRTRTKKSKSSTPMCTSTLNLGSESPYKKRLRTKNISVDRTRAFRFIAGSPNQSPIYKSKKSIVVKKISPTTNYDEKSTMPSTPIRQSGNPIFVLKREFSFNDDS